MSEIREFSLTSPSRRRVGNADELESLYNRNKAFEKVTESLMTKDNRRKGIQCLQLDLLRKYQTTFQLGSLPYEQDRRKLFLNQLDVVQATENAFKNRFVCPRQYLIGSSLPVHALPPMQEQSRLHHFLGSICRNTRSTT